MDKFTCGSHHVKIAPLWANAKSENSQRIFSHNPDKDTTVPFFPIGVDALQVFDGQHTYNLFTFLSQFKNPTPIITLTIKEKQLIISSGISKVGGIVCFEEIYPFFKDINFVNNASQNYIFLLHKIKCISNLNIKGGATDYWSRKYMHKVARKIKKCSLLDASFAHASSLAYQEAFKLIEARPERKVIALDFNSMYASCMAGEFADPANLVHQEINKYHSDNNVLPCGIYRVLLSNPINTFIREYHALKYCFLNKKYPFNLKENHSVETLLHSNEITYYAIHFSNIFIFEGIFSMKSISHPLLKDVRRTYAQRLHYKRQGNYIQERLCKLQLATMYGSVKRRRYHTATFNSVDKAMHFLQENFGLECPDVIQPIDFFKFISDGNHFTIKVDNEIKIRYLTHHANTIIFGLYSQVIANARVKMMQAIEFLKKYPDLELCYCNIDSMHVSIPADSIDDFYSYAAPLIGEDIGMLKIEMQADCGYWYEPGRYWLIRDNAVVLFKNQGLNSPYSNNPFQDGCSYYKKYHEDGYSIPVKCHNNIVGMLTYTKKLTLKDEPKNISFSRYEIDDIASFSNIQESILDEIEKSANFKIKLFETLSACYKTVLK
ncbi:hypothetical protein DU754_03630 [Salmonella enterica subsp. enterica]|nr:hypothetical protein [Salmonella enterica subsp. enterica serovar Tokoin]